ncbi:hypothetical protein HG536_0A07800 [Torulaspora globosa]|uniref:Kinesin-like protein KIP2 n=1 Tax=Torulaspora globosa TaxID=48254 RepID=A0A7G3ZBS9_9SACH|nr:uncharacterized protein HG536_0A07800 [Torulaspora globosa]QLL30965.1 hypothetical protein HG536_0A07800 [Torulaspora globosa]
MCLFTFYQARNAQPRSMKQKRVNVMPSREAPSDGGGADGNLGSSLEGFHSMIQKNSGSLRKPTMRSNTGSTLGQSPTLRSTSSISSLRKSFLRSNSISTSGSSRSASPTRSCSSQMGPPGQKIRIVRSSSNESPCRRRQDSYAGNISVVIRPKPVVSAERDPWHIENQTMISHEEAGEFSFDHVFSADSGNLDVYERTSRPMIDKLLEGFNSTVFAYGMTGSGKTFTMTGTNEEPGLIPLSVSYLFSKMMEQTERGLKRYEVVVSYLEIYNEKIYDLLDCDIDTKSPSTPARMFSTNRARTLGGPIELRIRDDSQYGVRIVGLTEKICESSEELSRWIEIGDKNRRTSETIYNTRSSRSHAVVLVRVNNTDLSSGLTISTTLSLCDLAGSEKAVSEYERRKEGAYINKSLLALGTVISKLSAESSTNLGSSASSVGTMNTHIPYRDSKLTRLLQPALSGNSIVTTICTIDTRSEAANETINTIRFASRAKNVTLQVVKRRNLCSGLNDDKDHLIESLNEQLEIQQQHVARLEQRLCAVSALEADGNAISNPDMSRLRIENQFLKDRLNHCERLLNKDTVDLQDSEMVAIIDLLPVEVGNLLETRFQNFESQLREYKDYTRQLESKLMARGNEGSNVAFPTSQLSSGEDDLIQIKQSEITELKKTLDRKDKMIDALQSAKRLRQRVLQPIENKEENYELKRTGRFY